MRNGKRTGRPPQPAGSVARIVLYATFMAAAFLLSACSTTKGEGAQPDLPVHYVHHDDLDVTWREQHVGTELIFDGVLRNNGRVFLQNLCMTVTLLDEEGTVVDSQTFVDFPMIVRKQTSMPFRMKFPYQSCRQGEQVIIDFTYTLANAVGPHYNVSQSICSLDEYHDN
ncbi:hypothetical protein LPW11_17070 [Geomonas sp. RF6]|uniref:hypothetical protein n=1 Tax=Geomonas sp. RF6 TaxID=2897342 RepID=UPI001E5F43E8|nr:hypothetical protein [Geomonas sp. RF6]UFS69597.1 hypothetical protein LPW11_17070 [Geomonas sp. RF6]